VQPDGAEHAAGVGAGVGSLFLWPAAASRHLAEKRFGANVVVLTYMGSSGLSSGKFTTWDVARTGTVQAHNACCSVRSSFRAPFDHHIAGWSACESRLLPRLGQNLGTGVEYVLNV